MTYDYDLTDPAEHEPRIRVLLEAIPLATEEEAVALSDELTDLMIASGTVPTTISDALRAVFRSIDKGLR